MPVRTGGAEVWDALENLDERSGERVLGGGHHHGAHAQVALEGDDVPAAGAVAAHHGQRVVEHVEDPHAAPSEMPTRFRQTNRKEWAAASARTGEPSRTRGTRGRSSTRASTGRLR